MVSITVQFHEERAVYAFHLSLGHTFRAVLQAVCFLAETVLRHWHMLKYAA